MRTMHINTAHWGAALPHIQSEMNRKRLRQLYSVAQMEVKRQATKAKLEEVDKDIVKWLQVMQVGHHAEGHGLGLYSTLLSGWSVLYSTLLSGWAVLHTRHSFVAMVIIECQAATSPCQ